ncbi:hypothetical protein AAHN93_07150 [Vandammella animalimorsus]|uniref:Uncharacterized protein n=1 Tax=Vandammella animalimorsus TaxID=2029117 RepID=A0A2A2B203_9BURK|nr:hypothetical protein [Vandammella animalimorsus]PAT44173.1 hypothetical protein CK621_00925 [Vandammella animalimorsus]
MIGLLFLGAGLAWLAFSCYMAVLLAKGAAIRQPLLKLLLGAVVLSVMLVGPFLDHIIGMRQFERLCNERAVIKVSETAAQVKRAKRLDSSSRVLLGYWIKISYSRIVYVDVDTNQEFLRYEILNTKGGVIGGLFMLEGSYQCTPKDYSQMDVLDVDKLVRQGEGL